MKRLESIANTVNDNINPVVVKELRQAVQSRLVMAILFLFLAANVFAVCAFITLGSDVSNNPQAGQNLFQGLYGLLVVTSMIFVPLYAAIRLTMERNNSNIDLLYITTIPPGAVIRGKFWAAVLLTVLIYAACMPFLTLTYLLRGIDLPSIFFALGCSFLMTTVLIMVAIFVGSVPGGMFLRFILGGILLYSGGTTMVFAIATGIATTQFGLGSMFLEKEAWGVLGLSVLSGLTGLLLAYLLAVAAVSPKSSNRMFPTRVFLTISWLVYGVIAASWSWIEKSTEPLVVWTICSIIMLIVSFGLVLAERESWSPRVRRTIPRSTLLRFLAWLFYTGSAGGVLWAILGSVATLLIASSLFPLVGATRLSDPDKLTENLGLILLFTWCYGMSGLFLRRLLLPRSAPLVSTVLGLILLGLGGTLPLMSAYFFYDDRVRYHELPIWFVITNPFVLLDESTYDRGIIVSFLAIWAVLCLIANWRWFRQQWREFKYLEGKPLPDLVPEVSPESAVAHA